MFIRKTKKTNSAYVIAIVLSLMAFFIFSIAQRTRITEYRLKYNGDVAYEHGSFGDAEVYYRKALKKIPGQYIVQYNLGNTYYKQERYAEAVTSYRQTLKTDNDSLKLLAWNNLGNAYYKQNELFLSADAYKNALLIGKDNVKVRRNFLFVLNKLESRMVKTNPKMRNTNQEDMAKKNGQEEKTEKDIQGKKANHNNTAANNQISDKNINDIFKIINQNEDKARSKISRSKQKPVKIMSAEPDY